jgi:2-methylcitrate synthase
MSAAKKTGGLAGVTAGATHICTVGKEGAGLTYRGYDIYDLADNACFEEVAYLLLHGKLPNQAELDAYIEKIKANRGLPDALKAVLEMVPGDAHPMDVLRTGVSFLGNIEPEGEFSNQSSVADRLLACIPSASTRKPETTASPGISCTCCTTRNRRNCTASASIRH